LWLGTPQTPLNLFVFRVAAASRPQTERGEVGRSRSGKPLLSGASDPVAESCGGQALGRRASASRRHYKLCLRCGAGARRARMRSQGIAPLQPWRTRGARRSEVPTRLRRVARRRAGPARPNRLRLRLRLGLRPCWVRRSLKTASNSPHNNHVTFLTHTREPPSRVKTVIGRRGMTSKRSKSDVKQFRRLDR